MSMKITVAYDDPEEREAAENLYETLRALVALVGPDAIDVGLVRPVGSPLSPLIDAITEMGKKFDNLFGILDHMDLSAFDLGALSRDLEDLQP